MRSAVERRRSLLTYAFISHTLAEQRDILLGLVPLFRPIAEAQAGQLFSPKKFVDLVAEHYGLSMHPFVAEEMVPRLLRAGLLTTQGEHLKRGTYLFKAAEQSAADRESEGRIESSLETILTKFGDFIAAFPTLLNLNLSRVDLGNILFDWLIASETRGAEEVIEEDSSSKNEGEATRNAIYRFRRESDYLCARFVSALQKGDAALFDELARVSAGAMVSEVVLDLKNPPEVGRIVKDLTVLLDGPFAMDVLALTGKERYENAIYIYNSLKDMGARLATFEHSCDEIAGNIRGVLKNPIPLRVGPTGDALRKGEVVEAYVKEVLQDIEGFLAKNNIAVLPRSVATPPQDDRFFTDDQITRFGHMLLGWGNEVARERDVLSIAWL